MKDEDEEKDAGPVGVRVLSEMRRALYGDGLPALRTDASRATAQGSTAWRALNLGVRCGR